MATTPRNRNKKHAFAFTATVALLVTLAMANGSGSVKAAAPEGTGNAVSAGGVGGGSVNRNQAALTDTLLDEVGHLNRTVTPVESAAWISELRHMPIAVLSARRAAWLHLRVGEWELAKNEEPIKAAWHFDVARKRVSPADPLYGQAVYNKGVARFWNCDYQASVAAFRFLINHKKSQASGGFIPSRASLWLSHASACAGYHAEHGALGIPEPPRLDPNCAAAGLAMCFKRLGLPSDKGSVLPHIRVTGRGSNAGDVLKACQSITALSQADPTGQVGKAFGKGVTARILVVNEAALRVLPLPALAFVEHDHYVAVLAADKGGVTYSCSDCGAWPGGLVRLSWKQWRRMDVGAVIPIVKKGSAEDEALSLVLGEKPGEKPLIGRAGTRAQKAAAVTQALARRFGVRVATVSPIAFTSVRNNAFVRQVTLLAGLMISRSEGDEEPAPYVRTKYNVDHHIKEQDLNCGGDLYSLRCTFATICPTHDSSVGEGGPSCHDPVNLSTLEEEYTPEPDITVYNPNGPSIRWGRIYNSMRGPDDKFSPTVGYGLHSSGFGAGWSHTYDVYTMPSNPDLTTQNVLVLQNGARIPLTASVMPSYANPRVACGIPAGFPFTVTWNYAGSNGTYYLLTWKDGSKWSVTASGIQSIWDANERVLIFDRTTGNLQIRQDSPNGLVLLTVFGWIQGYSGGIITEARDCYGRSVYYKHEARNVVNPADPTNPFAICQLLTEVSQVQATTGTPNPAKWRYKLDYTGVVMGGGALFPTLYKFQTPSPRGVTNEISTATLDYAGDGTMYVTSHTDANGNVTEFSRVDNTHTLVKRAGLFQFMVGFDNLMSKTSQTDNAYDPAHPNDAKYIFLAAYGADGINPTWVKDGTGIQTDFTYDTFGNVVTTTEPRHETGAFGPGLTTTYTYDYVGFPLGRVTSVSDGNPSRDVNVEYATTGSPLAVSKVTYPSPTGSGFEESQFTYDSVLGNLLTVTAPGGNGGIQTTSFNYVSDLNLNGTTYTTPGAAGRRGQPLSVTVSGSGGLAQTSHLRYDARGNVTQSWGPRKSGAEALYGYTQAFYNLADQVVESDLPARSATAPGVYGYTETDYLYVGGPVKTVRFYNESNSLIRQASPKFGKDGEALGGQTPTTSNIATQTLDAVYRPMNLVDGKGQTTNYIYYTSGPYKGRLQEVRLPGYVTGSNRDRTQFTEYDDAGRLTKQVDGNNVEATMTYSAVDGALLSVSYASLATTPPTPLPAESVSYAYDTYGRMTTRTDSSGVSAMTYNDADGVTAVTTTYAGLPARTMGYAYNADGSRAGMITPAGNFSYAYDGLGRPTGMSNPYGHVAGWTYWDNGALKTQSVTNQTTGVNIYTANYDANGLGQLNSLVNRTGSVSAPGAVRSQFDNTLYDGAGNLTQVVRLVYHANISPYSDTMAYQYSAKDEMTQERYTNFPYTTNYAYDAAGNASTYQNQPRAHNVNNQVFYGPYFVYDGNGNPTTYNGGGMTFDVRNNLVSAYGGGFTAGYTSEGLRAWKQTSGVARTYYLYDGMTPVVEMDAGGGVKAVNTFGAGGLLSRQTPGLAPNGNGPCTSESVFYTFDETGNVSERFDGSGNWLSVHAFQAVGFPASNVPGGGNPDPWGYKAQAGYYTDQETNLILCGFRYYDYYIGGWLTRDPIGYEGGLNLYAYVGGNPVMGLDPSGLVDIFGMTFDGETVGGGLKTGFAAVGSAFTFGAWDGGSEKCKLGFKTSYALGEIGRDALLTAGGLKAVGVLGKGATIVKWWNKGIEAQTAYNKSSLAQKFFYELGQATVNQKAFETLQGMGLTQDPVGLGRWFFANPKFLIKNQSRGFMHTGKGGTLGTGPTPGGRIFLRYTGAGLFLLGEWNLHGDTIMKGE